MKKIALLRGINVGGKRKILMVDLKQLFLDLGFVSVSTYIQSGNVIFESTEINDSKISELLESEIQKRFDFEVPVVVLSADDLNQIVKNSPFYNENSDISKLHLTFLSENPAQENIDLVNSFDFSPDEFKIIDKSIFLYIDGKYHKTKLSNQFFESKLKVKTTTRNWKTVLKLVELSS